MHISFWLLPFKDDTGSLQSIVDNLADAYDAPRFRPHVTLYSGHGQPETAAPLVEALAEKHGMVTLECCPLAHSEITARTLFVPLRTTPELEAMVGHLRDAGAVAGMYHFAPHLSLLYKQMQSAERESLARKLASPLPTIRFDAVQAVCTDGNIDKKADVEAWQTLAWARLRALP